MKKRYGESSLVVSNIKLIFENNLNSKVKELQNEGYEIEVKYQTATYGNFVNYTALLLPYKEEKI